MPRLPAARHARGEELQGGTAHALATQANGLKLVLKRISETVSAKDTEFEDQVHESSTMDKHYRNCAEAAVLLYLCM